MAARQIIVLETRKNTDGTILVNGVNWFPIANVAAQIPIPGFQSACSGLTGAAAMTTAEQNTLIAGTTREEYFSISLAASCTTAQIKAELQRRYSDRATAIAAEPPTRQYYGVSFDGTTWSA